MIIQLFLSQIEQEEEKGEDQNEVKESNEEEKWGAPCGGGEE